MQQIRSGEDTSLGGKERYSKRVVDNKDKNAVREEKGVKKWESG